MDFLWPIWDLIFNQIMTKPALLLGIVTLVGYIALRRPWYRSIMGAIKTSVGVLILQVGAGQLVSTFRPVLFAVSERFGIDGTIIDPYAAFPAVQDALGEGMAWVGYTILIGFALNLILVALKRWTKIRSIFLTGHIMFLQSALVTWIVYHFFNLDVFPTVLISGILVGLYWSIGSNALIEPTNAVTGGAGFSIGHQQMLADWLATKIAPKLGNPEDSVENIKLPGWLSIFQDNVISVSIVMFIFFGGLMLLLGPTQIQELAGPGTHWFVHIILTVLAFSVSVTIILTGVRMFVAELTLSFKGISEKVLPGAVIAVDCPALFAFSPQAMLFGFVMVALGQILGVLILVLTGSSILIIPGFVPLFFDGAPIAIYANKYGGWKAAGIICFTVGLIHIFGGVWAASLSGLSGGWMGNFDFATIWPAIMTLFKFITGAI